MKLFSSISTLFLSRAVIALAGFLLIPIYLQRLGLEALGVLTFLMTLQASMQIFDLGLSTLATTRSASLMQHSDENANATLLKTSELIYWLVGSAFSVCFFILCAVFQNNWVWGVAIKSTPYGWPILTIAFAAAVMLLTWVQHFYVAVLTGMQRQIQLSICVVTCAGIKLAASYLVLLAFPNLLALFLVHFCIAAVQILWLKIASNDVAIVQKKWRQGTFRGQFNGVFNPQLIAIAIIGTLLAQGDKLFLSGILTPADFAVYAVASMLSACLYMFISPLYSTMLPHFVRVLVSSNQHQLLSSYRNSSQLAAIVIVPAGLVLIFFSSDILSIWLSKPEIVSNSAPILLWLTIGTTAHGLLYVPYSLQLASGWTSLTLKLNSILLVILIPLIYFSADIWGGQGAAACWAILNVIFLLMWPYLMHKRLLIGEALHWYVHYALKPILIAGVCVAFWKYLCISLGANQNTTIFFVFAAYLTSFVGLVFLMPHSRARALQMLG